MPQVGIDTSEDAMPIEVGDLLTAKCNFWQILNSTKFSEAPESTKIWTGKLSNRPSTTAGLRLEGALVRYGFTTDETETTTLEGVDLYPVFDWHTRAKCPGLRQQKQVASWSGQEYCGWNWPPQKEHLLPDFLITSLFTRLCATAVEGRRMVHVAISRIAKRCVRALTVNITLQVEGGRRQKLSRWLSHRQGLALGSV